MDDLDILYQHAIDTLRLLALPYERQQLFFKEDFIDKPFEVLDTYNLLFEKLPKLIEDNRFSNRATAELIRLYIFIDWNLRNPKLADLHPKDFSEAKEWNLMRELAKDCLDIIGVRAGDPEQQYF